MFQYITCLDFLMWDMLDITLRDETVQRGKRSVSWDCEVSQVLIVLSIPIDMNWDPEWKSNDRIKIPFLNS